MTTTEAATGLTLLRKPFPPNQISKLPKPTKQQTEEVKANFKAGTRCQVCGSWHHPAVVHLDYVGHAALTDRLLDADPAWTWEPLSMSPEGLPVLDGYGGMWIRLTVCGVSRLGYGHAGEKQGGDAIKEVIGDALRNAAMRFGAALDLWHKGDLHADDKDELTAPMQEFKRDLTGVLQESIEHVAKQKTGARHAAAEEAGRMLDVKTKTAIGRIADRAAEAFRESAAAAFDLIEDQGLNDDERTYLWGLMDDSKLRSALKEEKQVRALRLMSATA